MSAVHRKSEELVLQIRNLKTGELSDLRLLVHPPTAGAVEELARVEQLTPLRALATLLARSDREHTYEWLHDNVEPADMPAINAALSRLLGAEPRDPNSPSPGDSQSPGASASDG